MLRLHHFQAHWKTCHSNFHHYWSFTKAWNVMQYNLYCSTFQAPTTTTAYNPTWQSVSRLMQIRQAANVCWGQSIETIHPCNGNFSLKTSTFGHINQSSMYIQQNIASICHCSRGASCLEPVVYNCVSSAYKRDDNPEFTSNIGGIKQEQTWSKNWSWKYSAH